MAQLLEVWNKKGTGEKEDVVEILECIKKTDNKQSAENMAALLKQLNKIHDLSKLDDPQKISDQILSQLNDYQQVNEMLLLAQQLKCCLTEGHTIIILGKMVQSCAKNMHELVTCLPLTKDHIKTILSKLESSRAMDVLKLVDKLIEIGFKFDKNNYQEVLNYLNDFQTVGDVYNLLNRLQSIGVTLETNIVRNIVNKLKSELTLDEVCNLLDGFKDLGASLTENTAVNIVNKLKAILSEDNICTLLEKFKKINVTLNSDKDDYDKNNVVHAIVKKFQSLQSVQNLLELIKTLQKFNIQPTANTFQHTEKKQWFWQLYHFLTIY